MIKVAVTGAAGFVGKHLVDYLKDLGCDIIAIDLPHALDKLHKEQTKERKALEKLLGLLHTEYGYDFRQLAGIAGMEIDEVVQCCYKKVRYVAASVTDKRSIEQAFEPGTEIVFHTAALFDLTAPEEELYRVNVLGTRNVCEAAYNAGVKRIINWSSSSVYGAWDEPIPRDEDFPVSKQQLKCRYAKSKLEQELVAFEYADNIEVVALRPANVYGPGTKMGLAQALYCTKIGLLRMCPGFKTTYSSHVHVDDVVMAAVHLARYEEAAGHVYNIADNHPVSAVELFEIVKKHMGIFVFPDKTKTFGIPFFHVPPIILHLSGVLSEFLAKIRKRKPLFESIGASYLVKNHILSNKKLLSTGYKLKWPDVRKGIVEVLRWYEQTGWKIFKERR